MCWQVRLGPIMAEDGVSVTIRATQGSADKGLAAVIVQAVRFIMHKTRELRSDTAIAHLNMLRGASMRLCKIELSRETDWR